VLVSIIMSNADVPGVLSCKGECGGESSSGGCCRIIGGGVSVILEESRCVVSLCWEHSSENPCKHCTHIRGCVYRVRAPG
jgi:hypothetical protein